MTAEKYVNAVAHQVKCSKGRRREIKQQLLSDICAAKEQGERTEDILKRMGSVQALAQEFNENLPETERKRFMRRILICAVGTGVFVLLLLAAVVWWFLPKSSQFGNSGEFQEEIVVNQTKEIIRKLDNNEYAELYEEMNPVMKRTLTPEVMETVKAQLSDEWGVFQSYGRMYMSEISQRGRLYVVVQVMVVYENISVTYTISFDKEMKLAGLYLK